MSDIFDMFRAFFPTPQEIRQELPKLSWQNSWLQALNAPEAEENLRKLTSVITSPVQLKNDKAHSPYWKSRGLKLVVTPQKAERQDFSHWPYKNKTGT